MGIPLYSPVYHTRNHIQVNYNTNVMIPMEIGEPSLRISMFNVANNSESLAVELDLTEEVRSEPRIQEDACKQRITWKCISKRKKCSFKPNALVWRLQGDAMKDNSKGKLSPNREGSFYITESL